jgi:hypothetical protein
MTSPSCPSEVTCYDRTDAVRLAHPYSGRCHCLLCADTRRGYGWPSRQTYLEMVVELRQRRRQGVVEARRQRYDAVS